MNRRLFRKWASWLLPLLAVRAFVPVGFMLSAHAGTLELVFCPGQAAELVQLLATAPAAQRHDQGISHSAHAPPAQTQSDHHHAGGGEQLDSPCVFALGTIAVALDMPRMLAADAPPTNEHVREHQILLPGAGPVRADRIRGPPLLS